MHGSGEEERCCHDPASRSQFHPPSLRCEVLVGGEGGVEQLLALAADLQEMRTPDKPHRVGRAPQVRKKKGDVHHLDERPLRCVGARGFEPFAARGLLTMCESRDVSPTSVTPRLAFLCKGLRQHFKNPVK